MSNVVQIHLKRLTAEAFAPFGQLICECSDEPPTFEGQELRSWHFDLEVDGTTELMYIHYAHKPIVFSTVERHFRVTQTFIPLGGAASVMVVAPPTDPKDWDSVPEPSQYCAFYVPGTVGIMLWRATWHAMTRFPINPHGAGFAFLTDASTQRELETQEDDGIPAKLTQQIDYLQRDGISFKVVDPEGLLAGDIGN